MAVYVLGRRTSDGGLLPGRRIAGTSLFRNGLRWIVRHRSRARNGERLRLSRDDSIGLFRASNHHVPLYGRSQGGVSTFRGYIVHGSGAVMGDPLPRVAAVRRSALDRLSCGLRDRASAELRDDACLGVRWAARDFHVADS